VLFNLVVGELLTRFGAGKIFAVMACLHPLAALVLWKLVRRERVPVPGG
jgi:ACS family hexuronate transporter-like MFS transporter